MSRLLVHIATGPENPTRAALGLLVARTALAAGHDVDVFFAGDGVGILRPETLDAGQGIGTGSFREHIDALVAGGVTLVRLGDVEQGPGSRARRPWRPAGHDGHAGPPRGADVRGRPSPRLLERGSQPAVSRRRWPRSPARCSGVLPQQPPMIEAPASRIASAAAAMVAGSAL